MTPELDQLQQFTSGPVWDGNLIGKAERDRLVGAGLVDRVAGWNFLSPKGVELCVALRLLNENRRTHDDISELIRRNQL